MKSKTDLDLYNIDDNIPIPEITRRSRTPNKVVATLMVLKPGKSFYAPDYSVKRISPEIARVKRTLGRVSFTTRAVKDANGKDVGVRVWRDKQYVANKRQSKTSTIHK